MLKCTLFSGRYMHSSVVFQDSLLYCGGFFQVIYSLDEYFVKTIILKFGLVTNSCC